MIHSLISKRKEKLHFSEWDEEFDISKNFRDFTVHAVQVVVPSVTGMPKLFSELLLPEKNEYLFVHELDLLSLIDHIFIEAFVKKGSLSAISVALKSEEFVTVHPSGKLEVSLRGCQNLGLSKDRESGMTKQDKLHASKITIDLLSTTFGPGKKWYMKVASEFQKLADISFDFVMVWAPHDGDICGTASLKEYFQGKGFETRVCKPKHSSSIRYSVPTPKFDFDDLAANHHFLEWIGAQTCSVDCQEDSSILDGYVLTECREIVSQLFMGTWQGLYLSDIIQDLHSVSRELLTLNNNIPFVCVVIHGFQQGKTFCFPVFQNSFKSFLWYYT